MADQATDGKTLTFFYDSVIRHEKQTLRDEKLEQASKAVGFAYSQESLKKGLTYIDYNNAYLRCAYLYKFSVLHTRMVIKYFQKLLKKPSVKKKLASRSKTSLKICCLGGGPGTDVVGIFQVLARYPYLHRKVEQVTVLDICGGWRNSFNQIMARLVGGSVEGVPATFVDVSKFKYKLLQVDLLLDIAPEIAEVIREADILSMVKFVSAVIGKPGSLNALKEIGKSVKLGSTVLFIDNQQGKVFESMEHISGSCGFDMILGPLHELAHCPKINMSDEVMKLYERPPVQCTKVSIMCWVKTVVATQIESGGISQSYNGTSDEVDSWETDYRESDSDCEVSKSIDEDDHLIYRYDFDDPIKVLKQTKKEKYTQTEIDSDYYMPNEVQDTESVTDSELCLLLTEMDRLLITLKKLNNTSDANTHCCFSMNNCCSSKNVATNLMSDQRLLTQIQDIQEDLTKVVSHLTWSETLS